MKKLEFTASESDRALLCTKSIDYKKPFNDSPITLEGNLIHKICELELKQIIEKKDYSKEINELKTNQYCSNKNKDMCVYYNHTYDKIINDYVNTIIQVYKEYKGKEIFIELRDSILFYDRYANGVIDCLIVGEDYLMILDLKTGRVKVDSADSNQLKMYALSQIQKYAKEKRTFKKIYVGIIQPLIYNKTIVEYSVSDIAIWYSNQRKKMLEIIHNKKEFAPSQKACKYCDYKLECNARIKAGILI